MSDRLDVGLMDHVVDERLQLPHSHGHVDDRRSGGVHMPGPVDGMTPRTIVSLSNIGQMHIILFLLLMPYSASQHTTSQRTLSSQHWERPAFGRADLGVP